MFLIPSKTQQAKWFKLLPRLLGISLTIVFVALFSVACGNNSVSTLDPAGPVADKQYDLLIFVFFIAVAVFVIVEGLIIFVVFKYRRKNDAIPHQTHGNGRLELLWTIIPAIIIIIIAVPTVQGIWSLANPECGDDTLQVEAIGHQWWFEFRYPTEQLITANELVVPTGRCVELALQSQDVLHSFWVPRLFGKRDMVPNRTNYLTFTADQAGEYLGQCAEFCGIAHAKMQFRVIAMDSANYTQWLSGWFVAPDPPAVNSNVDAGKTLFVQNCATCHTVDSYRNNGYSIEVAAQDRRWSSFIGDHPNSGSNLPAGSPLVSAPNLTHFGTRSTLGAGTSALTRETLFDWIKNPTMDRNGNAVKQGTRMQNHAAIYVGQLNASEVADFQNPRLENFAISVNAGLSDTEIDQIVDYLFSLKPSQSLSIEQLNQESGT